MICFSKASFPPVENAFPSGFSRLLITLDRCSLWSLAFFPRILLLVPVVSLIFVQVCSLRFQWVSQCVSQVIFQWLPCELLLFDCLIDGLTMFDVCLFHDPAGKQSLKA